MEVKFCPECGKPVQPALLSTKRQALKPRTTVPRKELMYSGYDEIMGILIGLPMLGIMIGLVVLIIPIIGWIASPFIIIGSCTGAPVFAFRALFIKWGFMKPKIDDYQLVGTCPYCDNDLSVNLKNEITKCKYCKERVLIKSEKFHTQVIRRYE